MQKLRLRLKRYTDELSILYYQKVWLRTLRDRHEAMRLRADLTEFKYPKPFYGTMEELPAKWRELEEIYRYLKAWRKPERVYYRNIIHREVLFDIDFEKWDDVWYFGNKIIEFLRDEGIPHMIAATGGKGVHVSIFFDYCSEVDGIEYAPVLTKRVYIKEFERWETREEYPYDIYTRDAIFRYVLKEAGLPEGITIKTPRGYIDPSAVTWGDEGSGHLVRALGTRKPDGDIKTCYPGEFLPRHRDDMYAFWMGRQYVYFPDEHPEKILFHFRDYFHERGIRLYDYTARKRKDEQIKLRWTGVSCRGWAG